MSSLITQPENLTKDRLKAELKKQGVPFSPTQPKSYYVQLYRERMMAQKGSPARRPRSEFSSDEDVGRKAKQAITPRGKRYSKVATPDKYMGDVSKMSDSELARELKEHDVNVGPITSSTRDVYRRRLAKLKAEKTIAVSKSSSVVTVASESDEFSSSDEEADPKPPQEKPPVKSSYTYKLFESHHRLGKSEMYVPDPEPVPKHRISGTHVPRPVPVPKGKSGKSEINVSPVLATGGWWSWLVWLFWLLLTITLAFSAGYLLFDVYLRGWGDSKVVVWLTPYLPVYKTAEGAGGQGVPPGTK